MKDNKYLQQKRDQADSGEELPSGTIKALQSYFFSKIDEPTLTDFLWDREVNDFIATLRLAGIRSFVYTNTSTAVMGNLHAFASNGCTIAGLCTINDNVQGIRISLQ